MNNESGINKLLEKQDELIRLQKHSIAIGLFRGGSTMDQIAKNLHISKATIVEMLKGVTREN